MNAAGYQKIERALKSVREDLVVYPGLLPATTDSKHYEDLVEQVYHFQPYLMEMQDARSIHGTNERIRVDSIEQSVAMAVALIRESAQP